MPLSYLTPKRQFIKPTFCKHSKYGVVNKLNAQRNADKKKRKKKERGFFFVFILFVCVYKYNITGDKLLPNFGAKFQR